MTKFTPELRKQFISTLKDRHGSSVTRKQILALMHELGTSMPNWLLNDPNYKVDRGQYNLGGDVAPKMDVPSECEPISVVAAAATVTPITQKKMVTQVDDGVPAKDKDYVAFGFHGDLKTIISSKIFYPVFVSGLSGNGKTTMVEQVCAQLKREVYRVNISIETDEDSLIGGQTMIDGNIVFREGPALIAMRRGAILLLDEIDRGSNKLMCLQAILEGKPFFNKKTGEIIYPADGFNVVATANTKGRGSDDGKFIAAQLLDEAFLERFAITVEQEYPSPAVETKIVMNNMRRLGAVDETFCKYLVDWADIIRKTFLEGGVDEVISTRRLVRIVEAYSMFRNQEKAIKLCIARFDDETKTAFMDLYNKLVPNNSTDPAQTVKDLEVNP